MARFRMYPTSAQASVMLDHCAHARYVWNLAVEQHAHWCKGRKSAPGFAEQCRQLTEARRENAWLAAGNADVQQQALKDFARAKNARFASGFGEPTWRRKYVHEGFRVIGTDRIAEFEADGSPRLNARTGKQVMGRSVVVQRLNRRWARVKVPGCGWVKFRLTRRELPEAKTFRVTYRNGQWHIAFAVVPEPVDAPGTGGVIGIDRGVKITAALSDGRKLNCPQLTVKERARITTGAPPDTGRPGRGPSAQNLCVRPGNRCSAGRQSFAAGGPCRVAVSPGAGSASARRTPPGPGPPARRFDRHPARPRPA
ncbi:transposase [Streptomyces sp. NPDC001634]|uniref:RNA-guided endonuclease InsQ/TnpB family protein n=1 Tax=Streptomyces sp. NPDC001634 TaxID=3154390 RepID=UPI00332FF97C